MRVSRLPDGSVQLSQLDDWQLRTLRSLPGLADPGEDEAALRRLYPAPFEPGETTDEQKEDWAELVQPELEQLFENSLERVSADVKNARLESPPPPATEDDDEDQEDEEDVGIEKPPRIRAPDPAVRQRPRSPRRAAIRPPEQEAPQEMPLRWEFTIPAAHVEDWYRAMNQARLILSERHAAHRTDDEHIARLFMSGRMEPLIQYELLTALCGWWVEVLMRR